MGITIFGRGYPLSAVDNGTTLQIAYNGTAIADITTSGLSGLVINTAATLTATTLTATTFTGTNFYGTTVTGTTVQGTTLCGSTAASAANVAMTYTGGGSATISAGTPQAISADRFLKATIDGQAYYIPAFASAGPLSAI